MAVCLVVLFHAGLWRVSHDGQGWNAHTMDLGPVGWYGSWFVMVMPLFFVTGGFSHAVVMDRRRQRGTSMAHYFANRGRRLVGPTTVFVTLFAVPSSIASWLGWRDQAVFVSHNLTKLLWFLVTYLLVVLLAPTMVWLHDHAAVATLAGLAAAATAVDWWTIRTDHLDFRYWNLAFAWLACHQIGIAYQRGWWRDGRRWAPWAAIGTGISVIVTLLHLAGRCRPLAWANAGCRTCSRRRCAWRPWRWPRRVCWCWWPAPVRGCCNVRLSPGWSMRSMLC